MNRPRMRWVGHVARVVEKSSQFKIVVEKLL
jgi:hypothetical protein